MKVETLLWTLTIVGAWNLASAITRFYYKEYARQYYWSIFVGVWALVLLRSL